MSRRTAAVIAVSAISLLAAHRSHAQERAGHAFLSASLCIPWSQGLSVDVPQIYLKSPGGYSTGWSMSGGVFVVAGASVEFEVSRTGWMKRIEPSRYNETYHLDRRDTFFTTALRLHTRPSRAIDVEPVVGFDVVKGEEWQWVERASYTGGAVTVGTPWHTDFQAVAGFSAGADFRVGGGRAALVASFRVHRTFRGTTDHYPGGTSDWLLRPGVGLRLIF